MTRTPKTYDDLYTEAKGLIDIKAPLFTNLANLTALIKLRCKWFWVGFYEVINNELVLSAFQGPPACVKISFGKGVCGKSWELKKSIIALGSKTEHCIRSARPRALPALLTCKFVPV